MPTRTSVRVETEFALPVEQAWPFFADFEEMPKAVTGVHGVTMTGSGIGAVRRVHFEERFTDERLEVMDHDVHRIVYRVVAKAPSVQFEDYAAEMALTAVDAQRCRFTWESHFAVPDGVDPEVVRAMLRRSYGISIDGFRAALERGAGG